MRWLHQYSCRTRWWWHSIQHRRAPVFYCESRDENIITKLFLVARFYSQTTTKTTTKLMPYHKAFHSTVTCLQPPLLLFYCVFFCCCFYVTRRNGAVVSRCRTTWNFQNVEERIFCFFSAIIYLFFFLFRAPWKDKRNNEKKRWWTYYKNKDIKRLDIFRRGIWKMAVRLFSSKVKHVMKMVGVGSLVEAYYNIWKRTKFKTKGKKNLNNPPPPPISPEKKKKVGPEKYGRFFFPLMMLGYIYNIYHQCGFLRGSLCVVSSSQSDWGSSKR